MSVHRHSCPWWDLPMSVAKIALCLVSGKIIEHIFWMSVAKFWFWENVHHKLSWWWLPFLKVSQSRWRFYFCEVRVRVGVRVRYSVCEVRVRVRVRFRHSKVKLKWSLRVAFFRIRTETPAKKRVPLLTRRLLVVSDMFIASRKRTPWFCECIPAAPIMFVSLYVSPICGHK